MILISPRRVGFAALAAFTLVDLSGCAVPLAPGYKIEKQSITVRFVPGSPPHLAIRAEYRLANTGNAPLDFIDLKVSPAISIGRENLRIAVDGQVGPALSPRKYNESYESFRIPLIPPWQQKHRKEVTIQFDLTSGDEDADILARNGFFLGESGWLPEPLAPKALFASDIVRPDPINVSVIVPTDFLALSSGTFRGTHTEKGETVYRFRIHKHDPQVFVVAGRYKQQRVKTTHGDVIFWTFTDLPSDETSTAAKSIASTVQFLDLNFGTHSDRPFPVWIAIVPAPGVVTLQDTFEPDFLPFPYGVLVNQNQLTEGVANPKVFKTIDGFFAPTLFQHVIIPGQNALLLAGGLSVYTSEAVEEKDAGMAARTNEITKLLRQFEEAETQGAEKPVLQVTGDDSEATNVMAGDKALLLPFALEDKCGRENVWHAMAHMVGTLRGEMYSWSDFRSAAEQECHQDLGPFFRTWLNEKGIPADFRAKYEPASQKKN